MTHRWTTEEIQAMLEAHRTAAQRESETHHRWLMDEATPYEKTEAEKALWEALWQFRNHGPEIVTQLLQENQALKGQSPGAGSMAADPACIPTDNFAAQLVWAADPGTTIHRAACYAVGYKQVYAPLGEYQLAEEGRTIPVGFFLRFNDRMIPIGDLDTPSDVVRRYYQEVGQ